MFHVEVKRTKRETVSTVGEMFINGEFFCYTLEDRVREKPGVPVSRWKVAGQTAIPVGTYKLTVDKSARFGQRMPLLISVPGFDGVRIHWGNTAEDTEGCILIGDTESLNFVGNSRRAYERFFPMLQSAMTLGEDASITITNNF